MKQLNILLTPNKELEKVFPNTPAIEFWNDKSLKDHLVGATLPKHSELCKKRTYLICDSINTALTITTEASQKFEKVHYLLKRNVCGEAPYVGKANNKFYYRFNNYKSKQKVPQKLFPAVFHIYYCFDSLSGIDDWVFLIFQQCEMHAQLKEGETFWHHRLKIR